ncbi:Eco57I restriction-modification methylase domain-containing protein [candidate division KSB1 bacterium]|nr:Eco57I restriction-modification methylase domain-containing protein [candidate division KSB1 bacterium]
MKSITLKETLTYQVYRLTEEYLHALKKKDLKDFIFESDSLKKAEEFIQAIDNIDFPVSVLLPDDTGGILAAALADRFEESCQNSKIKFTFYVENKKQIPLLEQNLKFLQDKLKRNNNTIDYIIEPKNFVKTHQHFLNEQPLFSAYEEQRNFDLILSIPPVYKISKLTTELKSINNIISGQANIFTFYLAITSKLLAENGQLIILTPEKFLSGFYFKNFRKWLLNHIKPAAIHLFQNDTILEDVILMFKKSQTDTTTVKINRYDAQNPIKSFSLPVKSLLPARDPNKVIPLPLDFLEIEILHHIRSWKKRLSYIGLKVASGRIIPAEVKSLLKILKKEDEKARKPLLWPDHLQNFSIMYPLENFKAPQTIRFATEAEKRFIKNQRYVMVKRIVTERHLRKVYAGYYAPALFESSLIALEKRLIYIWKVEGKLSLEESLGIMAILNSRIVNNYFRIISGTRPISAADIRVLPIPDYEKIIEIGAAINQLKELNYHHIDHIVYEKLKIPSAIQHYLEKENEKYH